MVSLPSPSPAKAGQASGNPLLGPRWDRMRQRLRDLSPADRVFTSAALLVGTVAVFVSYFRLAVAPAFYDETTYVTAAWIYVRERIRPPSAQLPGYLPDNLEHPPLAKLLFGTAESIAGHPSLYPARLVSATLTLLAAALLGWWVARAVSRWAGLLTVLFVLTLPAIAFPANTPLFRSALLDPVGGAFMVGSLYASWQWFRHRGRAGWGWALLTGVLIGLATAAKENGFLGAVGPILAGLVLSATAVRLLAVRLAQTLAAVAVTGAVFAASYLPIGHVSAAINHLWRFQIDQSHRGHLVGFAHRVSRDPPWWTTLWFAQHDLGRYVAISLALAAVAAIVLRHDRIALWLASALVAPFVFHSFIAKVTLDFYWIMWAPAFLALAAIGIWELVALARRRSHLALRTAFAMGAVLLVAEPAAHVVAQTVRIAQLHPVGGLAMAQQRRLHHLDGAILASGLYSHEMQPYTGTIDVHYSFPKDGYATDVDLVAVGKPRCRTGQDPKVLALVAHNVALGNLHEIYSDRILTLYAADRILINPTPREIARVPTGMAPSSWDTC